MPEPARELFDAIRLGGLARLDQHIDDVEGESLYLDFKESHIDGVHGSQPPPSELRKSARQVFAKAASAFANSDGGLLVWGVEAPDGRPAVRKPIPDPARFIRSLNAVASTVVEPPVAGIESVLILDERLGGGYVVTYIPRSEARPHLAAIGERTFYMRVGSSSVAMPHFVIRDAFLAKKSPALQLLWDTPSLVGSNVAGRGGGRSNMQHTLKASIGLKNIGSVIARHCAFAAEESEHGLRFVAFGCSGSNTVIQEDFAGAVPWNGLLYPLAQGLLYPGTTVTLGEVSFKFFEEERPTNLEFRYAVFADGFSQQGLVPFPLETWPGVFSATGRSQIAPV